MDYVKAYLLSMNRETLILGVFLIVYCLVLTVSHSLIFKREDKGSGKKDRVKLVWKLLCFVPLMFCIVHFIGYNLKGMLLYTLKLYLPMYIGGVIMAVFPFFEKRKRFSFFKVLSNVFTISGFCVSIYFLIVSDMAVVIGNGTHLSYSESFELLTSEMEKHYVMNDWKGIDYDKIKADLMPEIIEAEKNNDAGAFYIALQKYINFFHDGHIRIEPHTHKGIEAFLAEASSSNGNDYGFSLFTLSTGETVAVLVEDGCEAMEYGISDGTVITKWDGEPIDKAISEAEFIAIEGEPVLANMELRKPLYFAGTGGDTVDVTFAAQDGTEKTVTVKSMGSYEERLGYAEECLFHQKHIPPQSELAEMTKEEINALLSELEKANENFRSGMITDDCGYLVINSEEINVVKDTIAQIKGTYPQVTELVDKKLEEMKAQGMKKLVIDARNNGGGYEVIINAVVTLFAEREIYMGTEMYIPYTGGEMRTIKQYIIPANGKWADIPVIVLTNAQCGSSGDGLVYALSQCPNVRTAGISDTEGIYQSIGARCYLTDGDFSVHYSMFPTVDENGDLFIDTGVDRISRIGLDERIPVTRDAALEIFTFDTEGSDYELEYALGMFE